jgi:choline dehydrogenase-like flavoprotein
MEEFDAVIIGSGAGGAPVARRLIDAGKRVLVIEKGPLIQPQYLDERGLSAFRRDELLATGPEKRISVEGVTNNGQSYYSSHVEPDLNDEPHVYQHAPGDDRATLEGYTAQVVGGGTQLYGAVSLRYSEDDFRLAAFNADRPDGELAADPANDIRREARDWPIGYADLEKYYAEAEERLGINGTIPGQAKPFSHPTYQTPLAPNPISQFVESGMDRLGMARYRTPLAVITEDHAASGRRAGEPKTGFVNRYGDPLGYKSSTWVALLAPVAEQPNFTLWCNTVVTHLSSENGRVTDVHFRGPDGAAASVRGKVVVVACSAIESVRLLMLSAQEEPDGFGIRINQNGLLGAYFMTHCFGGAEMVVPGRFDKSLSLDSDWATDHCANPDYIREKGLWAGGAIYNNTSDQALPLSLARTHGSQDAGLRGEDLVRFLDGNFGRRLSVSFMANQVPLRSNRIALHPLARDKWNRPAAYILKDWHSHDRHVMNTLAAECKAILEAGSGEKVDDFGAVYMAGNARARIANHILGGARFGSRPEDSVLDVHCRAWHFDNLYVTDGSFMPTSGGANPTLTIQANAFRVSDHLVTVL